MLAIMRQTSCELMMYHHTHVILTLPETNSSPLKIGRAPKGKDRLPTIHFQGRTVSFREANSCRHLRTSIGSLHMGKYTVVECYVNSNSLLTRGSIHTETFISMVSPGRVSRQIHPVLVNLQFLPTNLKRAELLR